MKKDKKIVGLLVSCLIALSFLVSGFQPAVVKAGEPTMNGNPFAPYFNFVEGYPLPEGIIVEKDVYVEMLDGVRLACDIFRPDKEGQFPVIMTFTSWNKDLWGLYGFGSDGVFACSDHCAFEGPDPGFWVPNDYVVVLFDKRGYNKSEGQRGYNEREDYYVAIEWVAAQEWCDGNIGMTGVSSLANAQYYAASAQPPHLKAICVWGGSAAYPTSRFGGVPEVGFMAQAMRMSTPLNATLNQTAGPSSPVTLQDLQNITVPGIFTAQWTDQELHLGGTIWAYEHVSSEYKWLYCHGWAKWSEFYSPEALDYQKRFFDYFLKGIDNGWMEEPRVRLETLDTLWTHTNRYENEWPIARTEYTQLYLDANTGTLNFDEVTQEGNVTYNSTFTYTRASFDITFDQDTEITGHLVLHLWVSPQDLDDMDIFVTVKKLNVYGAEVFFEGCHAPGRNPVALGWLRLSNREVDEELSTFWRPIYEFGAPQKVTPGEIVPVDIAIYPTSTLFHAGETLRLIVSGKYLVQTGELGNPFWAFDDLNEGEHTIYTGGDYDSYLLVPMIPATFSVSDLSIQPASVEAKETVTITASVANIGGGEGTCTVVLNINGVKEAEQAVSLGAGESQDVSFSVSREEAATYTVAVEGLTGEFVVVPPPPTNYGPLYSGIVAGVIAVGLLSYYWMTRRRAY